MPASSFLIHPTNTMVAHPTHTSFYVPWQCLVYFAVSAMGATPIDGKTELNPEGLTAATGKHASAVAQRLAAGGLSCSVLDATAYRSSMLEKLVWISAFMAVGAQHHCTVGEVEAQHPAEVSELVGELLVGGRKALGLPSVSAAEHTQAVDRLNAYARSVAHFPTAMKEFEWRNGT